MSKSEEKSPKKDHTVFLVLIVVIFIILTIVGWGLYFVRDRAAKANEQKLQRANQTLLDHLRNYEDVQEQDLLNQDDGQ